LQTKQRGILVRFKDYSLVARIALDIGGTFTDLVAFDLATGAVHQAKSSTTPYDLAVGIAETLGKSGLRSQARTPSSMARPSPSIRRLSAPARAPRSYHAGHARRLPDRARQPPEAL